MAAMVLPLNLMWAMFLCPWVKYFTVIFLQLALKKAVRLKAFRDALVSGGIA